MLSAVFLDRDGTLNVKPPEGEYVTRPEELTMLPGAGEAVARLNAEGIQVVLVTNQRGIALGRMTEQDLHQVHDRLALELEAESAHLDQVRWCPHDRRSCECRKPGIKMMEDAVRHDPTIDLRNSALIGDAASDIEAAKALGIRSVLVGPNRSRVAGCLRRQGIETAATPDVASAVEMLLSDAPGGKL